MFRQERGVGVGGGAIKKDKVVLTLTNGGFNDLRRLCGGRVHESRIEAGSIYLLSFNGLS